MIHGYFNSDCYYIKTNFHTVGSPTFTTDNKLFMLAEEYKWDGIGGTKLTHINKCFVNGEWSLSECDCLREWKNRVKDSQNIDLDEDIGVTGTCTESFIGAIADDEDATTTEENATKETGKSSKIRGSSDTSDALTFSLAQSVAMVCFTALFLTLYRTMH